MGIYAIMLPSGVFSVAHCKSPQENRAMCGVFDSDTTHYHKTKIVVPAHNMIFLFGSCLVMSHRVMYI